MRSLLLLLALTAAANAETMLGERPGDTHSVCVGPDKEALYSFRPGCRETLTKGGQSAPFSFNQLGLRDRDYPPQAGKGVQRILVLGPSRLVGPGLDEADTPPRSLERELRGAGYRVEVINAGTLGYSTAHSAAKLPAYLAAYHPSLVLFSGEALNSAALDRLFSPDVETGADGRIRLRPRLWTLLEPREWLRNFLLRHDPGLRRSSAVFYLLKGLSKAWRCRLFTPEKDRAGCALADTVFALRNIRKQAEDSGARFVFAVEYNRRESFWSVPPSWDFSIASWLDGFHPSALPARDEVLSALREADIPFVAMPEQTESAEQANRFPGDYHQNTPGARAFGRALAEALRPYLRAPEKSRR